MKRIALVFAVLLIISVIPINVYAADPDTKVNSILAEATEYNGNFYLLFEGEYTWNQAKLYCEGLEGHLATITSKGEDDVCFNLFKTSGVRACWLGATDASVEGVWKWVTNEPWKYSNWGADEPNGGTSENVLNYHVNISNGRWNDSTVDSEISFICEWEKENVEYVRKTFGYISSSEIIYNNAFYYNGNVYKVFQYDMSFNEAKAYCESLRGHLATITSKNEDKAVYTYISKLDMFRCALGGSDARIEGLWEWANGEKFSYANWDEGEPNDQLSREDYLQYCRNGKWNDTIWDGCFLCEWDNCCILADGTVTEHSFGEAQIIISATCMSKGQIKRVCSGCYVEVTEDVDILPHNYNDWEITTDATCHSSGESTRICNDCGYKEVQAITALMHQWNEWNAVRAATCHASGLNERSCMLCGDKEQQDIEQLTHDYGEYIVVSGNKLIPPIVREKTCNLCGDVQTYKDWSYVWVTIIMSVAIIGVIIGLINYVRAFKKR